MASSNRPGVEITQELSQSASVSASPALIPLIMGVCNQIVEALDSDGALNADAKYASEVYRQASLYVPQASFPDPRSNIDELDIDEASIQASLYFGGTLRSLDRGSNDSFGSAFLKLMNRCRAAAVQASEVEPYAFDEITGNPFTFALDVVNSENTGSDITVTLVGAMTAAEIAAQINLAVGSTVASAVSVEGGITLQLQSPSFGATSSITIRAGTSALPILFGSGFDSAVEYRVEGAGFWGQDDEDSDLTTPWIEFSRGGYFEDGAEQLSFPTTSNEVWPGQVDLDGTFNAAKASAVSYTGTSATVPLCAATSSAPGDQFWADGAQVGGGEVVKAEASRFKIGKLNNTLSTFDSDGSPTNRVYDTVEVNTANHGVPFAPKYSYFRAQGLVYGSITPEGEAATLTGATQGLPERPAMVHGASAIAFPASLASLVLNFQVTEDGVQGDEVSYTFAGGPYATAGDLVDALSAAAEFSQLTVSCPGDVLLLQTTKTGAGQSISIKSTGSANTSLKFSTSTATADSGKDVEFAAKASVQGESFALPMTDLTSLTFEIHVTDSKGTHSLTSEHVSLAAVTTLGGLVKAVCEAFGSDNGTTDPTIYDCGVPVATVSSSGDGDAVGTLTVTTIEGGSSVSLALTAVDASDGWRFVGFHDDVGGTPAELLSEGTVDDFIDLAGIIDPANATTGFKLTIVGAPNAMAADVYLTDTAHDMDEVAADLQTAIRAIIGGGATVTVAWVRTGHFLITAPGASSITVAAPDVGTDYTNQLFGGTTDQDAVATTWTGAAPTTSRATIEFTHTDGVTATVVTGTASYAMSAAATPTALAALLNSTAAFNGITAGGERLVEWFVEDDQFVCLRTIKGGTALTLDVAGSQAGFEAIGFDVDSPLHDAGATLGGNADDDGADSLKSTLLAFTLDDNPFTYSIVFDSNSLQDAIDGVNALVNGSEDVASETSRKLTLTSLLTGAASKVEIDEATSTADTILGLTGSDEGAGRPNPDFYLDGEGSAHLGPNILRNRSSGIPFSLESAAADIYLAYTALRRDVSASAADPGLLDFTDTATMEAAIGPISTKNPLALGVFLALLNCPTYDVSALGVDEASAAAPEGTLSAWSRAFDFVESKEVYTVAPLTADEYVQGLAAAHVVAMSAPEERGERIAFICSALPDRAVTVTVSSGEDGASNGTVNSFTLDKNPNSELISNGIDPSDEISASANLYLELVISSGGAVELRRYSVKEVNGVILVLRTSFAEGENDDGFFTTADLDESLSGADWSLKIRGDLLLVTGTQIPDLNAIAAAAAAQASPYSSRRVYYVACDSLDTSINGVTQNIPGYYASAIIAGMIAQQPAQQPFTEFPMVGVSRVYGTDDTFSERQLDVVADGGRYVLVNRGGTVVARKQLSTSTTSIESKELSITKAVDKFAKGLRATNRVFIGRSVITSGFLDQLTICNKGYCSYVVDNEGLLESAEIASLLQDESLPDEVLIDAEVKPLYPCNKIRITIRS